MIALEQARQHLETLGLKQAVEILDNTLDVAANKQLTYPEMLEQLLGAEVAARRERYLSTRTKMAHFPFQKTMEQFDFAFQPSIDERQVKELASLAFVAEATNILLLGPPGVGKTHLAVALAKKAIERGYGNFLVIYNRSKYAARPARPVRPVQARRTLLLGVLERQCSLGHNNCTSLVTVSFDHLPS